MRVFVCVCLRYDKEANIENAHIYDVKTGECIRKYFLKKMTVSSWPLMKWSTDEETVCRMVSNVVEVKLFFYLRKKEIWAGIVKIINKPAATRGVFANIKANKQT